MIDESIGSLRIPGTDEKLLGLNLQQDTVLISGITFQIVAKIIFHFKGFVLEIHMSILYCNLLRLILI